MCGRVGRRAGKTVTKATGAPRPLFRRILESRCNVFQPIRMVVDVRHDSHPVGRAELARLFQPVVEFRARIDV